MKIQVDTEKREIIIDEEVALADFIENVQIMFPDWRKFKIVPSNEVYYYPVDSNKTSEPNIIYTGELNGSYKY